MVEKKVIDAMWDDSPVDVTTEVNFIWSIANKLRGPYRSDKYKDVIIPMTIIRRFECALADTKQAVVEQYKKNPNFPAKAMYRVSGYQFYNTSEYTLAELINDPDHLADNFKKLLTRILFQRVGDPHVQRTWLKLRRRNRQDGQKQPTAFSRKGFL